MMTAGMPDARMISRWHGLVMYLGARRLADGGTAFRVYADPAGHPFCLVLT